MTSVAPDASTTTGGTARHVAETAVTNIVLGAIGITTGVIAARWLGPVGRGELAAVQMWPSVLATVAMVGLPEALVYHSARHPSESRRYLLTACLTALAVMPIFLVIGYLLMPLVLPTQSVRLVEGARGYLLLLPMYALVNLPHHLLRGLQQYRLWNALRLVAPLLWLTVLIAAFWQHIVDPIHIAMAYLVLLASVGPLATWIVWKRAIGPAAPALSACSSLVTFGLPSALSTLPQLFNVRLDQMAVAAVLPAYQLGVYATAIAWSGCIAMLSSALAVVVSTRIAADSSEPERKRRFNDGIQGAALLIAAPVVLLGMTTPFGVTAVFGRAFQEAVVPAMILVIASGANAFNVVLEELLRGLGRPGAALMAEGIAVAVGLPLMLILLPRAGITGASIASLGGYLAATAVLIAYSRRSADLNVLAALDPRSIKWSEISARASRVVSFRLG